MEKDKTLLKIIENIEFLHNHSLEIGILAVDSNKKNNKGATILEYAVYNEFGLGNLPPRPFMRNAIDKNTNTISKYIDLQIKLIWEGEISGKVALMRIGEYIRGLIIRSIASASTWAVPLTESTLKAKRKRGILNNKTLIEDGNLIKSIRYQIVDKKGKNIYISNFRSV